MEKPPVTPHGSSLLPFDELVVMAQSDPDSLEHYRQQQINNLIDNAPEYLKQRLRGLQFQIDAQRQLHHNPLGACIKISQMMHDSFAELNSLLNDLNSSGIHQPSKRPPGSNTITNTITTATVVDFPNPRGNPTT